MGRWGGREGRVPIKVWSSARQDCVVLTKEERGDQVFGHNDDVCVCVCGWVCQAHTGIVLATLTLF